MIPYSTSRTSKGEKAFKSAKRSSQQSVQGRGGKDSNDEYGWSVERGARSKVENEDRRISD